MRRLRAKTLARPNPRMSSWRLIAAEARRSGTTPQKIFQKIYDGKLFTLPSAKKAIGLISNLLKQVRH